MSKKNRQPRPVQRPQPQKAPLGIRESLQNLVAYTTKLASETGDEFNKLNRQVENQNDIVAAIIKVVGSEVVQKALDEMFAERRKALENRQKEGVAHLLSKGILKPIEAIADENSFVVGVDALADGTDKRVQFEMSTIRPEFMPLYVGKKPGDVIEGNGAKLTVQEVYFLDQDRLQKSLEEESQAKLEAAKKAAEPTPPVDNEHVAEGCEKFSDETIAAEAKAKADAQ